jgi:hypothetical protein
MYFKVTAASSVPVPILKLADSTGTRDAQLAVTTSGAIALYDAANTKQYTFANSVVGQGWLRVEWSLTNSSSAGSLTVTFYNGNSTTPIASQTLNNINTGANSGNIQLGLIAGTSSVVQPFSIDDVGYGTVGPLGPAG